MGRGDRPFALDFVSACAGLVFAAVYGTGWALPIADAGLAARLWQENTARILIAIGALGSAGAVLALLSQWRWSA
jgi:hypothetical protein